MKQDHVTRGRPYWQAYLVGCGLVLFGLSVIVGWLIHEPRLVQLIPGFAGVPYSTALGFALSGLALIAAGVRCQLSLPDTAPSAGRRPVIGVLAVGLAGLVTLLGLLAFIEWLTGLDLGLTADPHAVQRWFVDTNPYSGRMRPLAAIGLMAMGPAIGLASQPRRPRVMLMAHGLALIAIFIGFFGVIGDIAGLEHILDWYIGPVFLAGIAFLAAGLAVLALLHQHTVQRWRGNSADADRIGLIAGAIVVFTGISGVMGGFATLYPQPCRDRKTAWSFP